MLMSVFFYNFPAVDGFAYKIRFWFPACMRNTFFTKPIRLPSNHRNSIICLIAALATAPKASGTKSVSWGISDYCKTPVLLTDPDFRLH